MAQTSINQLHPGVYGTISSQESMYSTASGVLTMFQADVFEKGPDNQLGFVTSFLIYILEHLFNWICFQTIYILIKIIQFHILQDAID